MLFWWDMSLILHQNQNNNLKFGGTPILKKKKFKQTEDHCTIFRTDREFCLLFSCLGYNNKCCILMWDLKEIVLYNKKNQRFHMLICGLVFLHDNFCSYIATQTQVKGNKWIIPLDRLQYISYSTDLALCNFDLFLHLK